MSDLPFKNEKDCFQAVGLTKSDLEMDVMKFIFSVFDRKHLCDQTRKKYHNWGLCIKLWMDAAEEVNEPCWYKICAFPVHFKCKKF